MANNIINATNMKLLNKYSVLKCIRENNVSRADLARMTSLTRASITNIVNELIQENLVIEYSFSEPKVGLRAINLAINGSFGYAIGVIVSRHLFSVNLINFNCEIIEEFYIENKGQTRNEVLDFFDEKNNYLKMNITI